MVNHPFSFCTVRAALCGGAAFLACAVAACADSSITGSGGGSGGTGGSAGSAGSGGSGGGPAGSTYFVAMDGDDANPGSLERPFRTIQRAASVMMPGETCQVRAGVYRETVRPARSGAAGAPIRFQAFAGETVTVSGSDPITGWQVASGAIFKAARSEATEQVFVDGQMMIEARWPNTDLDLFHPTLAQAGAGTGFVRAGDPSAGERVSDPALNQFGPGFWDGGVIWILAYQGDQPVGWWAQTQRIRASGPGFVEFDTLPVDSSNPDPTRVPGPGNGYYLTGRLEMLDRPTEWFHDPATSALYVWMPASDDPSAHVVEAKQRSYAFDLTGLSYIEVVDFNIFASTITMRDADHCTVDHVNAKYVSHFREMLPNAWGVNYDRAIDRRLWTLAGIGYSGIIMTGSDNQLLNSQVAYSAGHGVVAWGSSHRIENCLIHDANYSAAGMAAIRVRGTGLVIRRNRAFNTGRDVLVHDFLEASRVELNDLHHGMLMTTDGGITYGQRANSQGTVFAYNWLHDNRSVGHSVGLYLDNYLGGVVVHHNVIWNIPGWAAQFWPQVFLDSSGVTYIGDHIVFYNNTFYNCGASDMLVAGSVGGPPLDPSSIRFINNIFVDGATIPSELVEQNNRAPGSASLFVDLANGNVQLRDGSPAIDAGQVIPGITDGFLDAAPDQGAYEHGAQPWVPGPSGVSWTDPFPYGGGRR